MPTRRAHLLLLAKAAGLADNLRVVKPPDMRRSHARVSTGTDDGADAAFPPQRSPLVKAVSLLATVATLVPRVAQDQGNLLLQEYLAAQATGRPTHRPASRCGL